ncbi:hypothetical protein A2U01_0077476, partial [Trifolium medium]|nr:hypothetical protein [Trifolium medium]
TLNSSNIDSVYAFPVFGVNPLVPRGGAPIIQSSGQELFPPGIKLGLSRTIRPKGSSLTT